MGWEARGDGGRLYYYRGRKVDGRVGKEYVGAGEAAELIAVLDARERDARADAAAALRGRRALDEEVDAALGAIEEAAAVLAAAALLAAGYHRHHRGEWRRRRDG